MRETGTVTEVKGNRAVVTVNKKQECAGCGLCLFKDGADKTELNAANDYGAKVGDAVIVESAEYGKFLGAVLAFLVPLLLIGLAVLINFIFIKREIFILILSVVFIAAWYAVLAAADKKFKKSRLFTSRIVEIIGSLTDGCEENAIRETQKE